jgi:predicted phage terminase large subunit-like protein
VTTESTLEPQPLQRQFLKCWADIAIFGGAAYGGKSFALLLEPLYHVGNARFGAVIFRRTRPRLTQEGGLWDESYGLYLPLHARPTSNDLTWRFPGGASVSFSHIEHDTDRFAFAGAQICLLGFDQLEEFGHEQFWYMVSRNRSTCGVRPYLRATCNPDPDSWLATFLAWWIDQDTGLAIPERAGVVRWVVRLPSDALAWADSRQELLETYGTGPEIQPKSVTFFPSTMDDNPIGRERDPSYEANLMLLPVYLRQRLRWGNWKSRPTAGSVFSRAWFDIIPALPAGGERVRMWDLAGTAPSPSNPEPDYTVGVLMSHDPDGFYTVADVQRDRLSPAGVERLLKHTAAQDGPDTRIGLYQDPGQAGKAQVQYLVRQLPGYHVVIVPARTDLLTASRPLASQAEVGNVRLVRGPWNESFLQEHQDFPGGRFDDQVAGSTGSFGVLSTPVSRWRPPA